MNKKKGKKRTGSRMVVTNGSLRARRGVDLGAAGGGLVLHTGKDGGLGCARRGSAAAGVHLASLARGKGAGRGAGAVVATSRHSLVVDCVGSSFVKEDYRLRMLKLREISKKAVEYKEKEGNRELESG